MIVNHHFHMTMYTLYYYAYFVAKILDVDVS